VLQPDGFRERESDGVIAEQAVAELPDGTQLRGSQWRVSDRWMLLLHEPGADHDIDELTPLARAVARSGASVAAFDLPGHGFSDGVWNDDSFSPEIVRALLTWIDRQAPATTGIAAVGASCYPALAAATDRRIDTLVLVSPTPNPDLHEAPQAFRGNGAAKLLITSGREKAALDTARELRRRSIGWAMVMTIGSEEQGAALLAGSHSGRIAEGVELFLREQWTMGRRRGVPVRKREMESAR
jgi:pimeloyl-ACP methyl ester carboxylesterase